jgi:uncharacterized protein (DUF2141 family)
MRKTLIIVLFLSLYAGNSLFAQSDSSGTLEIEFLNIRNGDGQIAIGINMSPKGWPRKADLELQYSKSESQTDSTYTVVIPEFAYGTYAISVLDDVDSNLEMDMFLRLPREGYGFSLNPSNRLSAPKFEECSFEMDEPYKKLTIHIRYSGKDKNDN